MNVNNNKLHLSLLVTSKQRPQASLMPNHALARVVARQIMMLGERVKLVPLRVRRLKYQFISQL